ncbi:MAG TPA: DUF305 domain-containing protein [Aeromicrobium sp.]|nr:DUF305 domain-containing protein [Aeromicrobium sp.]
MTTHSLKPRTMLLGGILLLALGSCSGQTHNRADGDFAQGMIPHHQQAVRMSAMAQEAAGPDVKALATRIAAAQGPEIAQMKGWLSAWKLPVEMDHGMEHDMPGMMPDDAMEKLGATTGDAFDRHWLQMMIEHHQGAIAMAETELKDGKYPEALRLARSIVKSQTAEIAEMRRMLK